MFIVFSLFLMNTVCLPACLCSYLQAFVVFYKGKVQSASGCIVSVAEIKRCNKIEPKVLGCLHREALYYANEFVIL